MSTIATPTMNLPTKSEATDETRLVDIRFEYDVADPYTVAIVTADEGVEATWHTSRDLIAEALTPPLALVGNVGKGNVRIYKHRTSNELRVTLLVDDVDMTFGLHVNTLRMFLGRTMDAVPPGSEFVDWDAVVSELLGAER
jgi:hypothetical protein